MIKQHKDRSRRPEAKASSKRRREERAQKRRATAADFRALERELGVQR
jgi:hypothetical protein